MTGLGTRARGGLAALVGLLLVPSAFVPSAAAASGPTAIDDATTVALGTEAQLPGATNDVPGSAEIVDSLTVFPTDQLGSLPKGSVVRQAGKTLEVAGHGTLQVRPDGTITFTPWTRHTGTVNATYRITDADGATDDGGLRVVVTAGGELDDVDTYQDVPVVGVDLLKNDTPGRNADGTPGTLDHTSVRFPDQPAWGATVSADRRTLTFPDVGVLTLDARGLLTYVPDPDLATPGLGGVAYYSAQDTTRAADGSVEHHTYEARIFLSAHPNQVLPGNDYFKTPFNASITLPGILNDKSSNPTWKLVPGLSRFFADPPGPGGYLSPDRRKLRYPGRGTWTINADGTVGYVPPQDFTGIDGATMFVFDDHGNRAQESLTVIVQPGPSAKADTPTVKQNVTTAVDVLDNDTPGRDGNGTVGNTGSPGTMDPTFVRFPLEGQPSGASVTDYQRTLTVPGQGVYRADRSSGAITFDPVTTFVGTAAPVTYSARDTVTRYDGRTVHNPTSAMLTATVTAITPVALNNWVTTPYGQPVAISILGNDRPGDASAPLDPGSVRPVLPVPAGSARLSADGETLTLPGTGRFVAGDDGVVTFTPAVGYAGRVPTIGYSVADANGTRARADLTVVVNGAATMRPTTASTRGTEPVVVDVLSNDDPPTGVGWDRSSVCLVSGTGCVTNLTAGSSSWVVEDDGAITYRSTSGDAVTASVTYRVRDTTGASYSSTLTVTVTAATQGRG